MFAKKTLFFFLAVGVTVFDAEAQFCSGYGEVYSYCGSACPKTCDSGDRACTLQCVQGCFCREGLIRGPDGKCIPPDQCPNRSCPTNEEWNDCGLKCQPSCATPFPACEKICTPGCYCRSGYVREDNSGYAQCVPQWRC